MNGASVYESSASFRIGITVFQAFADDCDNEDLYPQEGDPLQVPCRSPHAFWQMFMRVLTGVTGPDQRLRGPAFDLPTHSDPSVEPGIGAFGQLPVGPIPTCLARAFLMNLYICPFAGENAATRRPGDFALSG